MDNVGGWVRQARHRAKKYGVPSTLTTDDVSAVVSEYASACAYCGSAADTMDHAVPMLEGGPNVPANVLPCCRVCKFVKRNRSIVWMFNQGIMPEDRYVGLVGSMLGREGSRQVKLVLRRAIGMIAEDDNV